MKTYLRFPQARYLIESTWDISSFLQSDYGAFIVSDETDFDFFVSIDDCNRSSEIALASTTIVGDQFEITEKHLKFRCLKMDQTSWERSVRTYLSAHIAGALYRTGGYLRLHGGLVEFEGKNVFVCGPSGAGKSSLTLALTLESSTRYFGHEMIFVNQKLRCIGWPQPVTVSDGTLNWFTKYSRDVPADYKVEHSVREGMKHRVHLMKPLPPQQVSEIDLVLFPTRLLHSSEEQIVRADQQFSYSRLCKEIEIPITFGYSAIARIEDYMRDFLAVVDALSRKPAMQVLWSSDQRTIVRQLPVTCQGIFGSN